LLNFLLELDIHVILVMLALHAAHAGIGKHDGGHAADVVPDPPATT
jgi:hypothetical protein